MKILGAILKVSIFNFILCGLCDLCGEKIYNLSQ